MFKKNCDYSDIIANFNAMPNTTNNIAKKDNKERLKQIKNSKKILYEAKAFIDKLNLVDVMLYIENKMYVIFLNKNIKLINRNN